MPFLGSHRKCDHLLFLVSLAITAFVYTILFFLEAIKIFVWISSQIVLCAHVLAPNY